MYLPYSSFIITFWDINWQNLISTKAEVFLYMLQTVHHPIQLHYNYTTSLEGFYSQDHAEHDEDVPQSDEDAKVSQAEQKLSDVVA